MFFRTRAARTAAPAFETLEPRALLSAPTAAFAGAYTDATSLTVLVDWGNTNAATIGTGDLRVAVGSRDPIIGTFFSSAAQPNGSIRAAYRFTAYDNAWGVTDNGNYAITSPAGQILSPQGDPLASSSVGVLGLFFSTPKARLVSQTIRPFDWLVVVQYDTLNGLNQSTIDATDLSDSGANDGIAVSSIIPLNANSLKVVYQIKAQGGAWSYTANGLSRLSIGAGRVADSASRAVTAHAYQDFPLFFATPKVEVLTRNTGENDWEIPVRFSALPGSAINPATLVSDGAVTVTGPGGYNESAHLGSLIHNPDGSYIATYVVPAKGGSWDFRDNGNYVVNMTPNRVSDASSRFVPGYAVRTFGLFFSAPGADVATPLGPQNSVRWDITVHFLDDTQIDRATINVHSIRVVAPDGLEQTLTLQSLTSTPANSATAVYRLFSPGGFQQGTYQVFLNRDGFRDSGGRIAADNLLGSYTFT